MSERTQNQDQPAALPEADPAAASESRSSSGDDNTKLHVWTMCSDFFWDGLSRKQKWILLGILGVAFSGAFVTGATGGYLVGDTLSQSKVDTAKAEAAREAAEHERETAKLEGQLADAKRQLERKQVSTKDDKPTIETVTIISDSYTDFLSKLNEYRNAGSHSDILVSALLDRYRNKGVSWNCVILHKSIEDRTYRVGIGTEAQRKDQAFVQFGEHGQFDPHIKLGSPATIEGLVRTADDDGVLLYDCRFAITPTKKQD